MSGLVSFLWGPERIDVVAAAAEITGNITMLEMIAPKNLDSITEEQRAVLHDLKTHGGLLHEA